MHTATASVDIMRKEIPFVLLQQGRLGSWIIRGYTATYDNCCIDFLRFCSGIIAWTCIGDVVAKDLKKCKTLGKFKPNSRGSDRFDGKSDILLGTACFS